jgi:hypothetical protein
MSLRKSFIVAALALAATAPIASAGSLEDSLSGCDNRGMEQPFMRWLDVFHYVLMPDGGLENGGEGWRLTGGADVVNGNEPWSVHGDDESHALALPAGSTATTGATCTALTNPVMRFFVRRTGGSILSTLRVDALYETAGGKVQKIPNVGLVLGIGSGWQPTLPMVVLGSVLAPIVGDQAIIAFRFTPSAGSSWRIDDVYLDPFAKH